MTSDLSDLRDPGWGRLLAAARRRLESSGGALAGSVGLMAPTEEERRVAIAITGRHRGPDVARIAILLSDVDDWLRRAHGLGLVAVLNQLGPPLRDRLGERAAEQSAREATLARARSARHAIEPWYQAWIDELATDGTITRLARRGDTSTLPAAITVLDHLPATDLPLPMLAERVCGDTKALSGTALAGLVLRALAALHGLPMVRGAAEQRALWEASGVIVDDLASQALVLNLRAAGGVLAGWLCSAANEGIPFRVTLHQLVASPLTPQARDVYVCENPAVLRAATSRLGSRSVPLICTEGAASVACRKLVAACLAAGATVWWRNDFDWPGLRMTAAALATHPDVRPWRMGCADYAAAASAVATAERLAGPPATSPWDQDLAVRMAQVGVPVMEERLVEVLLADIQK